MKRLLCALALGLCAAPAARAEGLALSAAVDRSEVPVGGSVTVTVRLENKGSEPVELPELALDRQLVSLEVQLDDGRRSFFERIHPSPYNLRATWPKKALAPGETWQLQEDLPAIAKGTLKITAHYGRWAEEYRRLHEEAEQALADDPENAGLKEKLAAVERQRGVGELPHLVAKPVSVKIVPYEGHDAVSVRMLTSMGPVRFRLFAKEAPATCMHFVKLIREGGEVKGKHRQPFYRGLTFHRVISGFMIQGGCPQGNGLGGPGYAIPAELAAKDAEGKVPEKLRHVTGRLSMARSSHYDSAGSQFFVCVADSPNLDGEYTVFGEVARGLDVILSIAEVPTGAKDKPLEDVTIEYMEVLPDVAG